MILLICHILPYFAIFCHSCCLMLSLPFVFSALIQTWGAWLEQKSAKTWSLSDFIPLDTVRLLELLDSRHSLEYFGMLLSSFALTLQSPKIGHWKSSPLWVCWSIIAYNKQRQCSSLRAFFWRMTWSIREDTRFWHSSVFSSQIYSPSEWQLWQLWLQFLCRYHSATIWESATWFVSVGVV